MVVPVTVTNLCSQLYISIFLKTIAIALMSCSENYDIGILERGLIFSAQYLSNITIDCAFMLKFDISGLSRFTTLICIIEIFNKWSLIRGKL